MFSYYNGNGLRELCEGLLACEGKLSHLGFDKALARSGLSDADTRQSFPVFTMIYEELLQQYHSFISESRLKVIDSSTIQLFSKILRGVGRNTKDGSKKRRY